MSEFDYTKKYNIQHKIDKFAKKCKNKKVILYGAGKFAQYLFEKYDFSKLNITAIADKKYKNIDNEYFYDYKCISPDKINELKPDTIIILNIKPYEIINYLYDFELIDKNSTQVEWLLKQNLSDFFKNKRVMGKPKQNPKGKYIFTFWEPKTKIPAYIQLCMNTWKKFLPDYEIIILDYTNLDEWLGFEYYDEYLYKSFPLALQADAIRIALLQKYGGIWLDADTIITSDKIKELFNKKSEVIMLGTHLAFIIAKKKAEFINYWLKNIKKNIFTHKMYRCFGKYLKYVFNIKLIAKFYNWDFLGNNIIDDISEKLPEKKFLSLDKIKYFALPEMNYYEDDDAITNMQKYIKFYFENNFTDYVFENTKGVILLHNSWTPDKYRKMTKEEFLNQNNTLSKILKQLGVTDE